MMYVKYFDAAHFLAASQREETIGTVTILAQFIIIGVSLRNRVYGQFQLWLA